MDHANDRLFTSSEIKEYFQRIGLDFEQTKDLSPLERLRLLHLHHLLNVPFDTTSIHLPPKWWSITKPRHELITLDQNNKDNNPELISIECDDTFNNIVKERRGGYCWSLNSCFARLLLSLGYQVNQLTARVFEHRNQDPNQTGYSWSALTHQCLLVQIESANFLCDVGFGGGSSAYPVPFDHDQTNLPIQSLTVGEKFQIVRENPPNLNNINLNHSSTQSDGFTLQRWCGEWWSPCYHFCLSPFIFKDLASFNWYATSHPNAYFKSRMVVSLLQRDGSRRSLICTIDPQSGKQTEIRLHTRKHLTAEDTDVVYVQPTYSELYKTLKTEFGWGPK